jgi:tetratricopeptide (TPR) repeat protein
MYRAASFFILWFFVILFPTSSFIPIKDVIFEHRVYMPSIGVFILISILLLHVVDRIKDRRKGVEWVVVIAVAVVIAVLSGATYARNKVWKDNVSLWEDVVAKSPNRPRAFYNLGNAYRDIDLLRAVQSWEKTVEIAPNYSPALNQLGNFHHMSGSLIKARDYYQRSVQAYHKNAEAHYNLAFTLEKLHESEEAYRHYEIFLEVASAEYEFLFQGVKRKLLEKKTGDQH